MVVYKRAVAVGSSLSSKSVSVSSTHRTSSASTDACRVRQPSSTRASPVSVSYFVFIVNCIVVLSTGTVYVQQCGNEIGADDVILLSATKSEIVFLLNFNLLQRING